jgi:multiple sugar transport system permease protein
MTSMQTTVQPGTSPAGTSSGESWSEWLDRHSGTFFIAPAVTLILIFSIFPTFYSIVFALSRVRFTGEGLQFRFVGFRNFEKQFFGSDQVHFLGKLTPAGLIGMGLAAIITGLVLVWWVRSFRRTTAVGMLGRTISAAMAIFLAWIGGLSLLSGNSIGTLYTTLFYVIVGCGLQFVIGTGLAFLCSQPISGRNFFRVVFFIPLMVTPLGVGYAMKMVADITKGPFEPILRFLDIQDWVW